MMRLKGNDGKDGIDSFFYVLRGKKISGSGELNDGHMTVIE